MTNAILIVLAILAMMFTGVLILRFVFVASIRATGGLGGILLVVLALGVLVIGVAYTGRAVMGGLTNYEQRRLHTLEARADFEAQTAAAAAAQAQAERAAGERAIYEAAAFAVRADTVTVSVWTMVAPPVILAVLLAGAIGAVLAWLEMKRGALTAFIDALRKKDGDDD